ncbi:MAG: HPr family phosphocarrier protein [Rhodospirillaceae bacterium]|nr:MAG: HPr family phosphocarrier protein [Rhodospirillaceae bacterium]
MGRETESGDGLCQHLRIQNERGLHARAAAKFVRCVARFEAEIVVACRGNSVSGLSIMGLLTLAASRGTWIEVKASGQEAAAALAALAALVRDKFEES